MVMTPVKVKIILKINCPIFFNVKIFKIFREANNVQQPRKGLLINARILTTLTNVITTIPP